MVKIFFPWRKTANYNFAVTSQEFVESKIGKNPKVQQQIAVAFAKNLRNIFKRYGWIVIHIINRNNRIGFQFGIRSFFRSECRESVKRTGMIYFQTCSGFP